MSAPDRRLTFARPDLADVALRRVVVADRFAEPVPAQIAAAVVALRPDPDATLPPDTELLFGEQVAVLDRADGWAWVQAALDGYVGYVPEASLGPVGPVTHRVVTLGSQVYARPALKLPAREMLSFGARVGVAEQAPGHARIGPDRWVPLQHLAPLDHPAEDWVAVAERFLGVPYVWGGRSSLGLDCSALIQLSRQAAGHRCPRDSDMQEAALGAALPEDAWPRRGDLIFWRGHVGVMLDAVRLLHANAHHMRVEIEPLDEAIARIAAADGGPVTRRARLDGPANSV